MGQKEVQAQAFHSILGRAWKQLLLPCADSTTIYLVGDRPEAVSCHKVTPDLGTTHVLRQVFKDPLGLPVWDELGWQALGS